MQTREAEEQLAQEVERHIDAEFRKCVDLAGLHSTGLSKLRGNREGKGPMPLQLPPRFSHLIPKAGNSHIRLATEWVSLPRAGSSNQG